MADVCAFIFARGGSKGVPRKNLRAAGGISLLERSISTAKQVFRSDRVFVSTDDDEIASEAVRVGAQVIIRGPALSSDNSPEWFAWQHAITTLRERGVFCDVMVSIPPTAPLRLSVDIQNCVSALDSKTDCVVTMVKSPLHPAFNMVSRDDDGMVRLGFSGSPSVSRRQDARPLYAMTTVAYVAWADFVLSHDNMWQGRVRGVEIPPERALDVDSEWDLHVADLVLRERNKDE